MAMHRKKYEGCFAVGFTQAGCGDFGKANVVTPSPPDVVPIIVNSAWY